MASLNGEGEEDFGSLFEGMIVIDPFISHDHDLATPAPEPREVEDREDPSSSCTATSTAHLPDPPVAKILQLAQPLDKSLFSDLTAPQADPSDRDDCDNHLQYEKAADARPSPSRQNSSSSSRKKKRGGFRIGYGRPDLPAAKLSDFPPPCDGTDAAAKTSVFPEEPRPDSDSDPLPNSDAFVNEYNVAPVASPDTGISSEDKFAIARSTQVDIRDPCDMPEGVTDPDQDIDGTSEAAFQLQAPQEEELEQQEHEGDPYCSIETKLGTVRRYMSGRQERIHEAASSLSSVRKELVGGRRKAAEDVSSASLQHKDLEKELDEACEAEDFERAERVSEKLAAAEKAKETSIKALKDAEAECNAIESKIKEVLEMQISLEEEGASMLEALARDAADRANMMSRDAEEFSSKRMEEYSTSTEALEIKKMELDIHSHIMNEASSSLKDSMEILIKDDREEKELLIEKRERLSEELDKLLVLVRLKEAEIAENNHKIENVERKIEKVKSEFHSTLLDVNLKCNELQKMFSEMKSEIEALTHKKKEVDEFTLEMERKRSKLIEVTNVCRNEAKTFQELADSRKSLSSSILKFVEDKISLVETEEKIMEDVKKLKQDISASRASLQELASTRIKIQQEVTSFKQRVGFIDKRGPELEDEKKVAAAARNFKEAGRIAAEAKALGIEKEELLDKTKKANFELEQIEVQIKDTVDKLQESEMLILSREKEEAIARCKRLQLVATAAMAERKSALEMSDFEEAEILLAEAEATNSEAIKLQQAFDFETEEIQNSNCHFVSMALLTSLSGQKLADIIASAQLNV